MAVNILEKLRAIIMSATPLRLDLYYILFSCHNNCKFPSALNLNSDVLIELYVTLVINKSSLIRSLHNTECTYLHVNVFGNNFG